MLTRIGLLNFKCFERLDLPCAPLNLLCGLNGMGKSSVIQALLVLRQSFAAGHLEDGRLVLGGRLIDLGAGSDVMFEDAEEEVIGFALRGDLPGAAWAGAYGYSGASDQLTEVPAPEANSSELSRCFGAWGGPVRGDDAGSNRGRIPVFADDLVYVEAERVGPRKWYPLSEVMAHEQDFGPRGEYAWNWLNQRQDEVLDNGDPRCADESKRRFLDVVDYWLQDVSPGAHLRIRSVRDADAVIAGFTFDRPGDVPTRAHRATNVGFGLSYVLPVVLALLSAPGTLCLIENPEAHLHPRGQTRLADLAARAAAAGVQVFAETHSDHFLDGVRLSVRNGSIPAADTAIHYFERDGGRAVVSSPTVHADGRLSACPAGFFDQHEQKLARLLSPRR